MQDVLQVIEKALNNMIGKGCVLMSLGHQVEGFDSLVASGGAVRTAYYEGLGEPDHVIDTAEIRIGEYPNAISMTASRSREPTAAESAEFYAKTTRNTPTRTYASSAAVGVSTC